MLVTENRVDNPLFSPLKNYRILLVDADLELAKVLKEMLAEMGFTNVQLTRSGKEAISQLAHGEFDFLITEWNTQHIDGMALLQYLRRNPNSPNPTIPIIMLTGRAEPVDVYLARDFGINEYVVKPFSARTIYNRLERIIENPRQFVVADNFIGPDRRAKGVPPPGVDDRRTMKIEAKSQPANAANDIKTGSGPRVWLPDFSLKFKLGKSATLAQFVTPTVLDQAQAAIDAITHDSLQWIRDNLRELKQLNDSMLSGDCSDDFNNDMAEVALMINARAGTFGYSRASEIAYMLYIFARNTLNPKDPGHQVVIQKHIEVLHVILGNQMRGNAGAVGAQIVAELKALVKKYS